MKTYKYKYLEKPFYKETIKIIKEIYELSNTSGGSLHIVLGDGNFRDCDIQWCIDNSIKECNNLKEKELCLKCAKNLLKLTLARRHIVTYMAWKEFEGSK